MTRGAGAELTPMELIRELATGPSAINVDVIERLVALQERQDAKRARAEFMGAMARLSTKLPRISKKGTIPLGAGKGEIPYAKYEDIDAVCRPMLAAEGLSVSFSTRVNPAGGVIMILTVAHQSGHSETSERPAPPDPGPGRNATQAQGSGESYAKRYLFNAFFNIITEGADDDGRATGFITDQQADCVRDLVAQLGSAWTPDNQVKFLKWIGADKIAHINASDYKKACNFLEAKARERTVL